MFEQEFIQQLLTAAKPQLRALVREVIGDESKTVSPLCVDYEQAGRMLGTTYEGIRKLVRKVELCAVSRGRKRAITIDELKLYIARSTVNKQAASFSMQRR